MSYEPYPKAIEAQYGPIKRARFCYLYTQRGKRLVDMYQEAGKAVLGWNFGSSRTYFKNTLNRGAGGSFETGEKTRLKKAVKMLFRQIEHEGESGAEYDFSECFSGDEAQYIEKNYSQWRPWDTDCKTTAHADGAGGLPEKIFFLPPFPLASDLIIFAAKKSALDETESAKINDLAQRSAAPVVPACVLAGITRSIYDLALVYHKRTENEWKIYDTIFSQFWTRRGAWLFPKMDSGCYALFAERALDAGIIVSPDYSTPSVVPWSADLGSVKALAGIMQDKML
ncbi:MAG: hypothetical protein Ta2A_01640 [Treponemataceae bacterium]|nr:MAG: hypothetical protein Ta2A_01640 [Treponemataceae bacterium]